MGIKSDIQQGKTVICLFLDFEKAFDSVWKRGLIVVIQARIQGTFSETNRSLPGIKKSLSQYKWKQG